LRGGVGRKAGTVAGFQYSDGLRNSAITWTEDLLAKWLENPDALVKDNDMEFRVSNADERAALVAYLKTLTN
jgi:cytochrome c